MIKIKKELIGDFVQPSRELTEKESKTVIARWGDDADYWYFTDKDKNSGEWKQYQEHLNQVSEPVNSSDETVLKLLSSMSPEGIDQIKAILK